MGAPRRRDIGADAGGLVIRLALLLVVVAVAAAAALLGVSATAAPDLGDAPRGPADGPDQPTIAATLGTRLATALLVQPTALASLSEADLTVIVRAGNPHPDSFGDPEARVRDGLVVVDGATDVGPLHVTAVGRFAVSLVHDADGTPDIAAALREVDAGKLTLPGFVRDRLASDLEASAGIGRVLSSAPSLFRLRPFLDCVAVSADSVVLGFHRPGSAPAPGACAPGPTPAA